LDQVVKDKAFVPGVAKYSLETTTLDKISKGPLPHYKRGR